jgi:hypothetical protein
MRRPTCVYIRVNVTQLAIFKLMYIDLCTYVHVGTLSLHVESVHLMNAAGCSKQTS